MQVNAREPIYGVKSPPADDNPSQSQSQMGSEGNIPQNGNGIITNEYEDEQQDLEDRSNNKRRRVSIHETSGPSKMRNNYFVPQLNQAETGGSQNLSHDNSSTHESRQGQIEIAIDSSLMNQPASHHGNVPSSNVRQQQDDSRGGQQSGQNFGQTDRYPQHMVGMHHQQHLINPQDGSVHRVIQPNTPNSGYQSSQVQSSNLHGGMPNSDGTGPHNNGSNSSIATMLSQQPRPAVGSNEWHQQRKDNHKEVERRRRETINEGINELAKIIPACEKNKSAILSCAVNYIRQLKTNEGALVEKYTLEKLLSDQAIAELSSTNERLQNDVDKALKEASAWKKACANAGVKIQNPSE